MESHQLNAVKKNIYNIFVIQITRQQTIKVKHMRLTHFKCIFEICLTNFVMTSRQITYIYVTDITKSVGLTDSIRQIRSILQKVHLCLALAKPRTAQFVHKKKFIFYVKTRYYQVKTLMHFLVIQISAR